MMKQRRIINEKIRQLKIKEKNAKEHFLVVMALGLKAQIEILEWVLE